MVNLLKLSDHDVVTVGSAGMNGAPDAEVLAFANNNNRILLTRNCPDFVDLHRHNALHPGIFVVYEGNEPSKNMNHKSVIKAIANVEASGVEIQNQLIELNQWNY